jgi:Excalibur calcium-binding domain
VPSPDRVQLEQWLRWVRARPWQVWATAGAVFALFAVLGAMTRSPAAIPVGARSLSDGLEQGTGSPVAPEPSATPEPGQPRYPGVAYPPGPATVPGMPVPTPTASAYYPNCAAAEAAGAAPLSRGRPGYRPELDRDDDGVACDQPGQPSSSPTTAPASPTSPAPTATPTAPPTATVSPTPSPTVEPTTEPPPPGAG